MNPAANSSPSETLGATGPNPAAEQWSNMDVQGINDSALTAVENQPGLEVTKDEVPAAEATATEAPAATTAPAAETPAAETPATNPVTEIVNDVAGIPVPQPAGVNMADAFPGVPSVSKDNDVKLAAPGVTPPKPMGEGIIPGTTPTPDVVLTPEAPAVNDSELTPTEQAEVNSQSLRTESVQGATADVVEQSTPTPEAPVTPAPEVPTTPAPEAPVAPAPEATPVTPVTPETTA